jgi:hypothetical protein
MTWVKDMIFANFHFWTIISHIQAAVGERFFEMTGSPSILDRFN